jgi:hypothetical protein
MPGSSTANWPTGSAESPPSAGFRTRKRSCSNSPGAMIASAAGALADERRTARMDAVGLVRAHGIHYADSATKSASAAAIAPQPPAASAYTLSGGCGSHGGSGRIFARMPFNSLNTRRQRVAIGVDAS